MLLLYGRPSMSACGTFGHPTRTDECPLSGGKADMARMGRYVG